MKKMNWKPAAACTLSLVILAGCAADPAPIQPEAAEAAGTVLLSVNPEIEVEYDKQGLVLEIEGINDDGKSVVNGYAGYEGRACEEVVNELVEEIYEAGYFEQSVGGRSKNIVIKLEEGSAYPDDAFLENVAEGVRSAVRQMGVDSKAMTVEEKDLDDQGHIGLDKAKELVLSQLDLDEASFTDKEYELDDGVYELEFTSGGVEYEFEVNAVNGKVLEADYDHNDDWNDRDDKYDDLDDLDDKYDDLGDTYEEKYENLGDQYEEKYENLGDQYEEKYDDLDDRDDKYDGQDDGDDDDDDRDDQDDDDDDQDD